MIDVVTIGDCTLYHGDALEVLPTLAPGSVDAVVTDPPYGVELEYNGRSDTFDEWKVLVNRAIPMMVRSCRGPVFVPTSKLEGERHLWSHDPIWRVCWYKGSTGTRCAIGFKDWEPVFVFGGRCSRPMHDFCAAFGTSAAREETPGHPCPKPISWAEWFVERGCDEGGTVADFFMGSGTTGVACVRTGRRFIGVEIERKYFDIACQRIEQAYADRSAPLFGETAPKAKQQTMELPE